MVADFLTGIMGKKREFVLAKEFKRHALKSPNLGEVIFIELFF